MTKLTKFVGYIFYGGWSLLGTFFYIKAVIEFIGELWKN